MATDYYRVLGVPRSASDKEIKAAFRKLARQFHPDVNPGDKAAEDRFKEISQANEVLSDTKTRAAYDKYGDQWQHADQIEQAQRRQGGGGFPGASAGPGGQTFTFEGDLSDLFGGGGAGGPGAGAAGGGLFDSLFRRSNGRQKGQDLEHTVSVTLNEAYSGAKRTVQLSSGGGVASRIEVEVPAGVADGQRIRIAGKGGPGMQGGSAGDLFLRVRVQPHPKFRRDGDDLRVVVDVPVADAALGGEVHVPTLKGKALALRVPAETQAGKVFRLSGQGMPKRDGKGFGDLFAEARLVIPERLSREQRDVFEMLRATQRRERAETGD
ncbi:MAG: J domain-containing protein [Chloroflexi bacterium]|nr:J domain-containing protein [Chloroflexota bacterium]MDA1147688.1 J domain-containing protein [Chloroflexota bacterium]